MEKQIGNKKENGVGKHREETQDTCSDLEKLLVSKECYVKISPQKHTLQGNFSDKQQTVDDYEPFNNKMRGDHKYCDQLLPGVKMFAKENPVYEDPRDFNDGKPKKPPRKRLFDSPSSPRIKRDDKTLVKEQKRKLTKKYETLITGLMDRCEENVAIISEKEAYITKLRDKLKAVLEYNTLFSEENDKLRAHNATLLACFNECKLKVQELETRNEELGVRRQELEERMKQYELPNKEHQEASTVPLVEVCMSCSSRQILMSQLREHNATLTSDMHALKDLLYRLTTQLSKCQERIRVHSQSMSVEGRGDAPAHKPYSDYDDLITAALCGNRQADGDNACDESGGRGTPKLVDTAGLLSAQALVPLFDAYQENIQEKTNLINDYEKQFEQLNAKSKNILEHNKSLQEKLNNCEVELNKLNNFYRKVCMEKDTLVLEKQTLLERAEKSEFKLKEVYELYEDKMSALMRDYDTLHKEYYLCKSALSTTEGRLARLDAATRGRTVPADLHERQVEQCKRLLEDLKHQYSLESDRKAEQMTKLQEQKAKFEEKYNTVVKELEIVREDLKAAQQNVQLYKKAATLCRARTKSGTASISSLRRRRRTRRSRGTAAEATSVAALVNLQRIRDEIRLVKSRALTSLQELEHNMKQRERAAARAHAEYRRELERAQLLLEHKEGIIRNLIGKVADIEEIRLSQTNAYRLQGISSSSSSSEKDKEEARSTQKEREQPRSTQKENVKNNKERTTLVAGHGGFYKDSKSHKVLKDVG